MDKLTGKSGNVCRGRFGTVEDKNGNKTEGIEMKCPGDDTSDRVVLTGNQEEAQRKAQRFLRENGKKAKIRKDN